ncbi:hypothetical protein [Chryseobacterium camelliae]|uniref:hypothetical protein n=1 Tax=Chryseobacterium camelliae TaxID=1265445 RepID=UPI001AE907CB|nr:hypothetical protein [Chryseobacterium camelliae]MDR6513734.1 hypothetical protein [Chryseobacterium camelliae]
MNDIQYTITYYSLMIDILDATGFVMDSETNRSVFIKDQSELYLKFDWSRGILNENSQRVLRLDSTTTINLGVEINDQLIPDILSALSEHENRNLEFIKKNSFGAFDLFENVYYSSFLDESIMSDEEKKEDFKRWLDFEFKKIGR